MANTLPRHMPVLGNVHPIKIENIDIFRDVISLLARVFILLIDRATQEVPMKNIWNKLSVQFLRYTPLNVDARCLLTRPEYIDLPGVCIQQFVMINWISQ